jgi:hypothetical protein
MNDLHCFQNGAGCDLPLPTPAGAHQEIFDWKFLEGLWHRKLEVSPQVLNRFLADVVDEGKILRLIEVKFVVSYEPA